MKFIVLLSLLTTAKSIDNRANIFNLCLPAVKCSKINLLQDRLIPSRTLRSTWKRTTEKIECGEWTKKLIWRKATSIESKRQRFSFTDIADQKLTSWLDKPTWNITISMSSKVSSSRVVAAKFILFYGHCSWVERKLKVNLLWKCKESRWSDRQSFCRVPRLFNWKRCCNVEEVDDSWTFARRSHSWFCWEKSKMSN